MKKGIKRKDGLWLTLAMTVPTRKRQARKSYWMVMERSS